MIPRERKPPVIDDNPEWTEADFAKATGPESLSEAELAAFPRTRGRPPADSPKEPVTMRLDQDILAHLRAKGPGWQTRVNDALKQDIAEGRL